MESVTLHHARYVSRKEIMERETVTHLWSYSVPPPAIHPTTIHLRSPSVQPPKPQPLPKERRSIIVHSSVYKKQQANCVLNKLDEGRCTINDSRYTGKRVTTRDDGGRTERRKLCSRSHVTQMRGQAKPSKIGRSGSEGNGVPKRRSTVER